MLPNKNDVGGRFYAKVSVFNKPWLLRIAIKATSERRNTTASASSFARTKDGTSTSTSGREAFEALVFYCPQSSDRSLCSPVDRKTRACLQSIDANSTSKASGKVSNYRSTSGEKHKAQQVRVLTKRQKERAAKDVPQRLAKAIAQAGFASRRRAEDLVVSGKVKVNSKVVLVPQHMVMTSIDDVTVDGKPLPRSLQKYYFALNKPKGYLCASKISLESQQQRLVVDIFEDWLEKEWKPRHTHANAVAPKLFTVGRLDVQTSGLIFVTNDGEWAQSVQHPSNNITKEYVLTTEKAITAKQVDSLAAGCVVDGAFVQPKSLSFATSDRKDKLRLVLGEGRNREVRAMAENAGLEVRSLKRVRIGGYRLPRDLSIGEFRELKPYVVKRVTDRSIEMNPQRNPVLIR